MTVPKPLLVVVYALLIIVINGAEAESSAEVAELLPFLRAGTVLSLTAGVND